MSIIVNGQILSQHLSFEDIFTDLYFISVKSIFDVLVRIRVTVGDTNLVVMDKGAVRGNGMHYFNEYPH